MDYIDKYEPKKLSEVVGQKYAKKEIAKRLKNNNISQNILMSGPTGTGKTTIAKIILKTLNCKNTVDDIIDNVKFPSPCNTCDNCTSVDNRESSPYFHYYDGSVVNKDLVINEIKELVNTPPMFNKKRFIYIEEIQNIASGTAFQSLLEMIGINHDDSIHFVMSTMDLKKIHKAVIDRFSAMHFKLKDLSIEDLYTVSYNILLGEKIITQEDHGDIPETFIKNGLYLLARSSNGSARNFIGNLEKCLYRELYTEEEIINELEIIDDKSINNLLIKLLKKDTSFFTDIQKYKNNLMEVFNKSYSNLADLLVYIKTEQVRFAWQEKEFQTMIQYKDYVENLINAFNDIYTASNFTIKRSFFIAKIYEFFQKSINEYSTNTNTNTSITVKRRRRGLK